MRMLTVSGVNACRRTGIRAETTTEDCDKTMKHTDIRAAVLDALEQHEHGATLFDGRPVVFDEEDFPAIAVYLTDAEYTGEELDADTAGHAAY